MSNSITHNIYLNLGLHFPQEDDGGTIHQNNISQTLAYIPIIGTIVGISRFMNTFQFAKIFGFTPQRTIKLMRESIEILSLGFLFIIPDLIVTIYRYYYDRPLGDSFF